MSFFPSTSQRSMWDLSSLTRDQTHALYIGSRVLIVGPPGKSHILGGSKS